MKQTVLIFLTFIFIFGLSNAQVNIGGTPKSFELTDKSITLDVPVVTTPALDMKVIEEEDLRNIIDETKTGVRFGIEHSVDYGFENSGVMELISQLGKIWRLKIHCPDATSINLIFDRYRLPDGATLYLYSEDHSQIRGGFTSYNNQQDYFFATDVVPAENLIIEYFEPINSQFSGELHLSTIVHGYRPVWRDEKSFGQSGSCQINVVCPAGDNYVDQIRAVFALYSGGTELCSGTILNNTAEDFKPYALTANHCYEAATNPGIWVFRFNWQSPVCSPSQNSTYNTMTGAVLRARKNASTGTDFCLVELNQAIPDSYGVFYSGWSRSTTPTTNGACISHPALDIKKITPATISTSTQYVTQGWKAQWQLGACTEGGSSGSGLFDSNGRLIGQEYGGPSYCGASTANMYDVYGRFDYSWTGTAASNRLQDWLDPIGLNPTYFDGSDPLSNIIDAQLLGIANVQSYYLSSTNITPKVVIKNKGTSILQNATIYSKLDNNAPIPFSWTGNLAYSDIDTVTLSSISLLTGSHTLKIYVVVAGDGNLNNDTLSVQIEVGDCLKIVPFEENFDNSNLLPDCWTSVPLKGINQWTVTNANGSSAPTPYNGVYNMRFYSASSGADSSRLESPVFDLSSVELPILKFYHAQPRRSSTMQDCLIVLYKSNPSSNWQEIAKYTDNLITWAEESIILPQSSSYYQIAFKGETNSGYGVLLDNVRVENGVKIDETTNNRLLVYPNPAGNKITVSGNNMNNLQIVNIHGCIVKHIDVNTEKITVNIEDLPSGIYFLKVYDNNYSCAFKKFVKID